MILTIFQNFCILITSIVFVLHYLRRRGLQQNERISFRIWMGIVAGIVAMILLKSSVVVDPVNHIVVDFRYVPVFLISIYGGWIPTMIATLIIAAYRLIFNDISSVSIWMALATLLIGVAYSIIHQLKQSNINRYILALASHTVIMLCVSFLITVDPSIRFFTLWTHLLSMYLGSYLGWRYIEYGIMEIKIHNRFKNEASTDFLTNLFNRRRFQDELDMNLQRCLRKGEPLSLMMLDIDRFKNVNDDFGHAIGDDVLREFAKILVRTCRVYDGIYRVGGEEFAIILQDCTPEQAIEIAERIRMNVEKHEYPHRTENIKITTSIGITTYRNGMDSQRMSELADTALYQAKNDGRNKVHFTTSPTMVKES
jgi:diguanylate cyclase